MTTRNVKKSLVGMEDIQQGVGTQSQVRAGTTLSIHKLDVPYSVTAIADMQALDIAKYTRARVYRSNVDYIEYSYDAAAVAGVSSNIGAGFWIVVGATRINSAVGSAVYDFAVHGGAIGEIELTRIPDNAVITRGWYEILTTFTGAGSSVSFGVAVEDITGLQIASSLGGANMTLGYHDFIPDGLATNFTTKTTAERAVHIRVTTAALTAGKARIWFEYIWSE